ncbi:PEF-CTERM sorting domain-containing protein [Methanomethylovorans sp.]
MYKQGTEIPEFPTVVLPVAVILSLAFVFMRKQE